MKIEQFIKPENDTWYHIIFDLESEEMEIEKIKNEN